ncbi:SRPBCC domain-containing protein [Flavobacterium sp. NG2]|uniref:SRPBCC domain-containing protein n=1 Tax=Flavobacterium sp. NG2 TaxID=3097547 RepID=UPI002A83D346|nr:SRPBCC domain-containing protein [Flavobacterium sp. NG2]WPR70618.1 SRPBCC domain-containing protein [Flavobacterium sp. NG2]
MSTEKITVQATINADKNKVWDYYTNPKHIVNWNFADPSWCCSRAENDMKVGGVYNARMEAKDGSFGFDFKAIYTEINLGEQFSYGFEGRTVVVSLKEENNKTEITVTFDPETENSIELQKNGWQAILNNFKNYTEVS